ncbi:hypothetical protein ACQ4PT_049436 [Festuca glaucescens]
MADHCCAHQEVPSYKENLAEEPKQHLPTAAAASTGRYTSIKLHMYLKCTVFIRIDITKTVAGSVIMSPAGWLSKERSTPEGINMKEHGWRFQSPIPQPKGGYDNSSDSDWETPVIRQRKPLEFELLEVRVISIFFEFGGGCIHYNFTAKQPDGQHLGNAGITKAILLRSRPQVSE